MQWKLRTTRFYLTYTWCLSLSLLSPVHLSLLSYTFCALCFCVCLCLFSSFPASRPDFMSPELCTCPGLLLGSVSVSPLSAGVLFLALRTVSLLPAHWWRDVMAPPEGRTECCWAGRVFLFAPEPTHCSLSVAPLWFIYLNSALSQRSSEESVHRKSQRAWKEGGT